MADKKIDIDHLINSYMEIADSSETLDDLLKAEGINPNELEAKGIKKIKHLLFTNELALKKASLSGLYEKALGLLKSSTENSKQVIMQLLQQKAPSLQFRNLEKLDEENLRQILNETELLDLMDKIEKGDLQ